MSIGAIGSVPSFYEQDQSYWSNAQAQDSAQSAADSLINVMGAAQVTKAKGLAAIANGTALKRVNSQLIADIQSVLGITPASSSSTSGTASSSSSSASTKVQPASGTGTIPVTTTTTLSSLGILPGGTITFGDGGNTPTVYTSTGTDTVGDLINAINNGPAYLTASINSSGKLTVTARNTTASVVISGSGAGELRRKIAAKRHRSDVAELAIEIGPDFAAHIDPALAERKILAEVSAVLGDHAFEQSEPVVARGRGIEGVIALNCSCGYARTSVPGPRAGS
jgi:hypothetical protein